MPTFVIHRIEYGQDDIAVVGRNGDESIPMGTVFTCAYTMQPVREAGELIGLGSPENAREIALTVVGIDTYGRELETLEPGLSGRLRITGEGRDEVESGDTLNTHVLVVSSE